MKIYGMGGPGGGQLNIPTGFELPSGLGNSMPLGGADGFGLGHMGYGMAFGLSPWGQQADMLNAQWGWPGFGRASREELFPPGSGSFIGGRWVPYR